MIHQKVFSDVLKTTRKGLEDKTHPDVPWFDKFVIHMCDHEEKRIKVADTFVWRFLSRFTCNKYLSPLFNEESDLRNEMKQNNFLDVFEETKIRIKRLLNQEKWDKFFVFCFQ